MIKWPGLILLAVATIAPAQEAARPQPMPFKNSFSYEKAESWIPFERKNGLIFIQVLLDGKPARALIDTGLTGVFLSKDYATAHGMHLTAAGMTSSIGGAVPTDATAAPTLQVGGLSTTGGEMKVVDLSNLSRIANTSIDVGIGMSVIRGLVLQVDFDASRLRLLSPGSRPLNGINVPVTLADDRVFAPLFLEGGIPVRAMIDLGQEGQLILAGKTAHRLSGKTPQTDLASVGAGGTEIHQLLSIDRLSLNAVPFRDVLGEIEQPGQFLDNKNIDAAIGIGLLSRYNFALDIRGASTLTLSPRATTDPPAPKSTIGVQVNYLPDRIAILHIMTNSPAAAVGLKAGDAICALDGIPITADFRNGPQGKWSIGAPGQAHKLSLCDGRTISLTTRAFY